MDESNIKHDGSDAEHTLISASLELEKLDENLFRSATRYLWVPSRARGVFGGQVISQALVAGTRTVPPEYHCHSLHCYFLQRADASVPIIYFVERVRQGRSFITRNIKASQRGKIVFLMLASFAVIEEGHPESQWPVHFGVKGPEESVDQADILQGFADATDNPQRKQYLLDLKGDRLRSPIEMRQADPGEGPEGLSPVKWWMRARNIPKYEASFQKCILSYISDLQFLSTTARAIRNNPENEGNTAIAMMASLDHSLWFYDHEFDCRDWLLFVMDSPRVGMGRGVVYGAFYNMAGKLIAATSQEGVVRGSRKANPNLGHINLKYMKQKPKL